MEKESKRNLILGGGIILSTILTGLGIYKIIQKDNKKSEETKIGLSKEVTDLADEIKDDMKRMSEEIKHLREKVKEYESKENKEEMKDSE